MLSDPDISTPITIESHTGPYSAAFEMNAFEKLDLKVPAKAHFLIDRQFAELYSGILQNVLGAPSVLLVEAKESNKSLDRMPDYVAHLIGNGLRRDHMLIAIGGGIIQDITCFLAATLLRGIDWNFYPTTLLAQADSCIGSKSSINAGAAKNILGTFTPPREVFISTRVLETLEEKDVRSGVGEMLKVHAIDGPAAFAQIAEDYDQLFDSSYTMMRYIRRSLEIKKSYIEADEFDRGPRNIFNYGHSFGHAIEAATDFVIPHGIGVTIGMDMANFVSGKIGFGDSTLHCARHNILKRNYRNFERHPIPVDAFLRAIAKDKKNTESELMLILPDKDHQLQKTPCANDKQFREVCIEYLENARAA
ncbi:MAG: 3-dehydroquinate synthase [Alphaproteobacteria bacterium MarineAlpha11_Bin1]|nr:MAG: 3-dehydroquinate synthase [Alphaproteobacteria bacterium MarineAlpha11_Bin1]|tara:strand:+ start:230 stop:1318 length:1089 start_codon:yes stop_codon:yes gene_type:complete